MLVDLCYAYKDDLVVILAGCTDSLAAIIPSLALILTLTLPLTLTRYTDSLADLFDANPGLASRFPHKFGFDDYTQPELEQIANLMLSEASSTQPQPQPRPESEPERDSSSLTLTLALTLTLTLALTLTLRHGSSLPTLTPSRPLLASSPQSYTRSRSRDAVMP